MCPDCDRTPRDPCEENPDACKAYELDCKDDPGRCPTTPTTGKKTTPSTKVGLVCDPKQGCNPTPPPTQAPTPPSGGKLSPPPPAASPPKATPKTDPPNKEDQLPNEPAPVDCKKNPGDKACAKG